ncbi:MAG: gamma-mobile-trio recombinase GmtY [Sulfuricaulis sp.]|nr:gamma-mobile-trio recombinase GmtY [Sulfuricaulis sp.]
MPLIFTTVKAQITTDNTGQITNLPVLLGRDGLLSPMIAYQVLFQGNSLTWHTKLCHAVRLLLEYAAANAGAFAKPRDLFESFSVRLRTGTFGPNGLDPSGLYWLPRGPRNANAIVQQLTQFSAWMAKTYGVEPVNPLRDATRTEQVLAAAAWAHRNNASFLGHAESRAQALLEIRKTPWVPRHRTPTVVGEARPRFPEERFLDLLFHGFAVHEQIEDKILRLDLRCVLITLLQHGGGVRVSECFHLWVQDVTQDPHDLTKALVRIGEPELGFVEWHDGNGKTVRGSRREYLARLGLQPRNVFLGTRHAGWKHPTLDGKWYLQVHWSDPVYGQLFLLVWRLYLRQLIQIERQHPWAFVNLTHERGAPMTKGMYAKAHARAVRRIGLVPKKSLGTTEHGHRHAYMYRLAEAKVDKVIIKRAAHHHSIESQEVYTEPELAAIKEGIAKGYKALESGRRLDLAQIQTRYRAALELTA